MSEPVCRWCRNNEAEHRPPTEPNRPRMRCVCLGWRENFVPDTGHVALAPQRPSVAPAPSENTRVTERQWDPAHKEAWIAVDFDGTLATYTEWRGVGVLGEPIPAMVERIRAWLTEGRDVRVFTARHENPECRKAIRDWCREHIGAELAVTGLKDRHMYELWDDRAVQVVSNTGRRADELSDAQRVAFVNELWTLHAASGRINMIDSLYEYERLAKERMR